MSLVPNNQCQRCVMDDSDIGISFDVAGVCSHCREYERMIVAGDTQKSVHHFANLLERIRKAGVGKEHDCVVGISGGADSSYVLHLAVSFGLRPLTIHLDNGWDSELATHNIHALVTKLDLDLVTHVVDWEEFKELQLAYLRAGVIDIEVLTDHAITALVHRAAVQEKVKFILSGNNVATESTMPRSWNYRKADLRNLRHVVRSGGGPAIRSLPTASTLRLAYIQYWHGIRSIDLLNYVDYDKRNAIDTLRDTYGWRDYGGKHYESLFTRFYQTYILPSKFGVDKRKAHLSCLINAGQTTRKRALAELAEPLYDRPNLESDTMYIVKKLGITRDEFEAIMAAPPSRHEDFRSDGSYALPLLHVVRRLLQGTSRLRRR